MSLSLFTKGIVVGYTTIYFSKKFSKKLDFFQNLWYNKLYQKEREVNHYGKDQETTPRGYP